jgi:TPP-dependent 2-oxoacid decarboxylase
MACAYSKYTGKLGACIATSGPGAIHLLNGLYDAKADNTPVIAITGTTYSDLMNSNYQQDESQYQIKMSKVITRYLKYIEELYQIIDKNIDRAKIDKKQLEKIRRTYTKVKREHGAEIKNIVHITRDEPFPRFYENTDFSVETIRNSIKDGESKTNQILEKIT